MSNLVKTDSEDFKRDTRTRVLVNTNSQKFHKYKKQKEATKKLTDRIDRLEEMVQNLLKENNG